MLLLRLRPSAPTSPFPRRGRATFGASKSRRLPQGRPLHAPTSLATSSSSPSAIRAPPLLQALLLAGLVIVLLPLLRTMCLLGGGGPLSPAAQGFPQRWTSLGAVLLPLLASAPLSRARPQSLPPRPCHLGASPRGPLLGALLLAGLGRGRVQGQTVIATGFIQTPLNFLCLDPNTGSTSQRGMVNSGGQCPLSNGTFTATGGTNGVINLYQVWSLMCAPAQASPIPSALPPAAAPSSLRG